MIESANHHCREDELGLLDNLILFAESWKLLVIGPLIAGFLVGTLSFLWPKTYESLAIVDLSEQEISQINNPNLQDIVIDKLGLLSEFNGSREDARLYLGEKLVGKSDKKTGLSIILARSTTPESARAMCQIAIDALLDQLVPKGFKKQATEEKIAVNQRIIDGSNKIIEHLNRGLVDSYKTQYRNDALIRSHSLLISQMAEKEFENIDMRSSLKIKGEEVYVQHPTLPGREISPKRTLLILWAVLVFEFVLILFLIARRAFRAAAYNDKNALKLQRIRNHFKPTRSV